MLIAAQCSANPRQAKAPAKQDAPVLDEDDEFAEFEGAARMEDGGCGANKKAATAELDEFQADWDDQDVDADFMGQLREQLQAAK